MDVETVAAIAWCLMAAVVVGAVLMYGCMHGLITQAYEEGRQESLATDVTPVASPQPRTTSAA